MGGIAGCHDQVIRALADIITVAIQSSKSQNPSKHTINELGYTCTVESILTGCITTWFGNSTAGNRKALQRVVRTARYIVGVELPSLQGYLHQAVYKESPEDIKDSATRPTVCSLLLPSGRRFRSIPIPH